MSATTLSPETIPTGTYAIDASHSSVGFEVKHMGIASVRGAFHRFAGSIDATGDKPVLNGTVEVASVDTGEENRDGHLTAPDFFDAAQYPEITFTTTALDTVGDGQIKLTGEITIKGVTKPIELTGVAADGGTDPWGKERVGFEVEGVIDRREFGLTWNQTLPNGNVLVANDVKLLVSVSAVKEA
jgi:polyisoprenoid-binding protein YceI